MRDLQAAEDSCNLPEAKQAQRFLMVVKPKKSQKSVVHCYRQPLSRDGLSAELLQKKKPGECLGSVATRQ